MFKKHITTPICLGIILTSCATTKELNDISKQSLTNNYKTITSVSEGYPFFNAQTALAVALQGGAIASTIKGQNTLQAANALDDPSVYLEKKLLERIKIKSNTSILDTPLEWKSYKKSAPNSNMNGVLLADIKTTFWGYSYFSLNWTRFRLQYTARLQLIDAESKDVIAGGSCQMQESHKKAENAFKLEEIEADNFSRAKIEYRKLADKCLNEILEKIDAPF